MSKRKFILSVQLSIFFCGSPGTHFMQKRCKNILCISRVKVIQNFFPVSSMKKVWSWLLVSRVTRDEIFTQKCFVIASKNRAGKKKVEEPERLFKSFSHARKHRKSSNKYKVLYFMVIIVSYLKLNWSFTHYRFSWSQNFSKED